MTANERCDKCGGNMFPSEDIYSKYLHCMQCGRTHELTVLGSLDEELAATLSGYRAKLGLSPTRR
jgi:DNA-directed RNA polymerase subunit M/transcription elongation factor TFIIS